MTWRCASSRCRAGSCSKRSPRHIATRYCRRTSTNVSRSRRECRSAGSDGSAIEGPRARSTASGRPRPARRCSRSSASRPRTSRRVHGRCSNEICYAGGPPNNVPGAKSMGMTPLKQAAALGQSIWIDYLSRDLLQSGRLMRLVSEGVVGVTSNPTIFEQAISAGKGYDEQLRDVRARTSDPKEMFLELAVRDVTEACDQLREVYDAGIAAMRDAARPRHVDGLVSIEVDPSFAYDTEATTAEAKRLHALIDRPNLLVKIPATKPGLPAIEDMIAAGHSINVTLIFSLQRYAEVAEAYIRGIE